MTKKKIAEDFAKCLPLLFDDEGGYCNDAHDPGGATKWGITHYDLAAWLHKPVTNDDVRNITKELAADIYKAKYWTSVHGDQLPAGVDYAVFDFAVNSGISRAAKYLQRIVGVTQDGIIGGLTLAAVMKFDPADIVIKLCDRRLGFLEGLRTWQWFGKGWQRRVNGVHKNALAWARAARTNSTPVLGPVVTPPEPVHHWWDFFTKPLPVDVVGNLPVSGTVTEDASTANAVLSVTTANVAGPVVCEANGCIIVNDVTSVATKTKAKATRKKPKPTKVDTSTGIPNDLLLKVQNDLTHVQEATKDHRVGPRKKSKKRSV